MFQVKYQKLPWNQYEIDLMKEEGETDYKKLKNLVIDVKKFSFMMEMDFKKFDLIFDGDYTLLYFPNHLNFCALIKSIVK